MALAAGAVAKHAGRPVVQVRGAGDRPVPLRIRSGRSAKAVRAGDAPRCDGGVGLQTAASLRGAAGRPEYGGIPHVAVLVRDAAAARRFYTDVLCMTDDPEASARLGVPGACLRAGAQTVHL